MSVLMTLVALGSLLADLRGDPRAASEAGRIAVESARAQLSGASAPRPEPSSEVLKRSGGAFVTVIRNGSVRGCWGSIHPTTPDLAREIASAAAEAMRADYRHRPVNLREWGQIKLIVSIPGALIPLAPGQPTDPRHEGLFITSGGRGGLLLPGEARSFRYQRAECLRKAGLRPRDRATAYRFETWTATVDTAGSRPGSHRTAETLRRPQP
jgi:AMMECR1 domain-containing protein